MQLNKKDNVSQYTLQITDTNIYNQPEGSKYVI